MPVFSLGKKGFLCVAKLIFRKFWPMVIVVIIPTNPCLAHALGQLRGRMDSGDALDRTPREWRLTSWDKGNSDLYLGFSEQFGSDFCPDFPLHLFAFVVSLSPFRIFVLNFNPQVQLTFVEGLTR